MGQRIIERFAQNNRKHKQELQQSFELAAALVLPFVINSLFSYHSTPFASIAEQGFREIECTAEKVWNTCTRCRDYFVLIESVMNTRTISSVHNGFGLSLKQELPTGREKKA